MTNFPLLDHDKTTPLGKLKEAGYCPISHFIIINNKIIYNIPRERGNETVYPASPPHSVTLLNRGEVGKLGFPPGLGAVS